MTLFEFVLEIQDGMSSYEQKEFVLAPSDTMAAQFAREFARHWRPNATYDTKLDVYSTLEGWPQWTLARCAPITYLTVPIAGQRSDLRIRVALVPELEMAR